MCLYFLRLRRFIFFYFCRLGSYRSLPSFPLTLISTVNKECAGFPQALKESLTLHSHNHFRPGCLGRHLRWDSPAASQIRPLSGEKKKKGEEEGEKTATQKQRSANQTGERHQPE